MQVTSVPSLDATRVIVLQDFLGYLVYHFEWCTGFYKEIAWDMNCKFGIEPNAWLPEELDGPTAEEVRLQEEEEERMFPFSSIYALMEDIYFDDTSALTSRFPTQFMKRQTMKRRERAVFHDVVKSETHRQVKESKTKGRDAPKQQDLKPRKVEEQVFARKQRSPKKCKWEVLPPKAGSRDAWKSKHFYEYDGIEEDVHDDFLGATLEMCDLGRYDPYCNFAHDDRDCEVGLKVRHLAQFCGFQDERAAERKVTQFGMLR